MREEERRRRDAAQDRALLRFSAVAAIFAATGAAALTLTPGEPGLRGLQHLALFAQPSRGRAARAPAPVPREEPAPAAQREAAPELRFAAPATPSPKLASAPPASDPVTVGAIPEPPARLTGRAAATPLADWRIYDLIGERALLAGPAGVAWAWPGVDLGAAGVVSRIELEREGVAVVTSRGAIRRR